MRRALIGLALLSPSAFGFGSAWYVDYQATRPEPERIRPPVMSWEQTPEHVLLHIHNVNTQWGLRDQPAHVYVEGETFHFVSYHPGIVHEWPDGRPFECCHISYLPPGGDYTIELLPHPGYKVAGIQVELRERDAWKRMD